MTNADVIIPVTTASDQAYLMAVVALRTCHASTSARIHAFINNSPEGKHRTRLIDQCGMLGINVVSWDNPFSLSKIFNHGFQMTRGEYIAYGTSDVIYYPGWLENIIELWKQNPQYFCLCNYSFDDLNMPCVEHEIKNEARIVPTHNPSSGVLVFRRDKPYKWDENIALWEIDTDILCHLRAYGLKAGYCLNSRCDHLIDCVKPSIHGNWEDQNATAYVRNKWKLPLPKEHDRLKATIPTRH